MKPVRVDWQPMGRRVDVAPGTLVLDAARSAGIDLVAVCGGAGLCEGCRVRAAAPRPPASEEAPVRGREGVRLGGLGPPTSIERSALGEEALAAGWRLACQAVIETDTTLVVPQESLSAPQRLQLESSSVDVPVEPLVGVSDVTLDPPALADLRADATRLAQALHTGPAFPLAFPLAVLRDLPERLRRQGWACRVVHNEIGVAAILRPGAPVSGLAVDAGTTKLAAYLVDLQTGATLAAGGRMNPQIAFGEDVISRIAWVGDSAERGRAMQDAIVAALNEMVDEWASAAGLARDSIVEAVLVGNTAMHHFVAGLPVSALGEAPYVPVVTSAWDGPASSVGLRLSPGARLHLPPNIAGYVGADHVAMLLAAQVAGSVVPTLAIDIGTNTEITLAARGRLLACSCASGPAFEGAHISQGMRAAPGAVERVRVVGDEVRVRTIGDRPASGVCGSGILDAVAEMRRIGVLDRHGAFRPGTHPAISGPTRAPEFVLVPAARTATGRDVTVSRQDVTEVQLAKAAIRAGIDVLLQEAGVSEAEVERVVIAGAFGTYVNASSAVAVGMLPRFAWASIEQIGNAAGAGARQILLSASRRREAVNVAKRVEYVELTIHPAFTDAFARAIVL